MHRRIVLLLALLCGAASVSAQAVATPLSQLQWDEVGQSVAIAGSATYVVFLDGAPTSVPLTGVTCVAGLPASTTTCAADFPPLAPGTHTLTGVQRISGVDSPPSLAFTFSLVVVVTPTGLRVK